MLAEMRPSELGQWIALTQVEPWGAYRDDVRAGVVAASLAPMWGKRKDGRGFKPTDFMPDFEPQQEMDSVDLSKRFRTLFAGTGPQKAVNRKT